MKMKTLNRLLKISRENRMILYYNTKDKNYFCSYSFDNRYELIVSFVIPKNEDTHV